MEQDADKKDVLAEQDTAAEQDALDQDAATDQDIAPEQPVAAKQGSTAKKLKLSVAAVLAIAACLCAVTIALFFSAVTVKDNLFHTGEAKINLNDGASVIEPGEFLFEPGMTVTKTFFVQNEGTWDVYYRLYLGDVSGDLTNTLEVTIKDGEKVLCSGTASSLTAQNVAASDDVLAVGERRELTICFHYPESAGNEGQGSGLSFTLCAQATQTKNNPGRLFE